MPTTTPYMLWRPPRVGQIDPAASWAAAMSSWLRATPGRPKFSQADLLGKFDKRDDHGIDPQRIVGRHGGLIMLQGFEVIAHRFGIGWQHFPKGSAITCEFLYQHLTRDGHLLISYQVPGKSWAHVIVAFGISPHQHPDLCLVHIMDPEPDNVGSWPTVRLLEFAQLRSVVIGWPC